MNELMNNREEFFQLEKKVLLHDTKNTELCILYLVHNQFMNKETLNFHIMTCT